MTTPVTEGSSRERKPLVAQHAPSGTVQQKNAVIEKIRPELNLEKWAIWRPAKSQNESTARVIEREISVAGGNRVSAKVEVGFTNRGPLTTEDQRTYYALIKYWEDGGRLNDQTFFSLRHLARHLRKKWGTNVIDSLTESLLRLRTVPFTWTNSYFDAATKETYETLDTFTILSELRIIKRKTDGTVNKEFGYFKMNDFILNNLIGRHTKPLLFETVLSFNSEIAQILYTYLDLILADKSSYERRTKELFTDLGLEGTGYRNRSNRKQVLERALREVRGAPLTTGRIVSAELEMTKDRKDYKLVIRKATRLRSIQSNVAPEGEREEPLPPQQLAPKHKITIQAEELVRYFYQVFHGLDASQPVSPAVGQAVTLIAQHGFEKAKYIVDFASRAAPETKYSPQTFGGILHYTSRAIADFERQKSQQEHSERQRLQQEERERQDRVRAQAQRESDAKAAAYLEQLAPEDRQRLYDDLVAEMRSEHAFLAGSNGEAFRAVVRRAMLNRAREDLARQADQT